LHVIEDRLKPPSIDEQIVNLIIADDEEDEKENQNKQEYLLMQ